MFITAEYVDEPKSRSGHAVFWTETEVAIEFDEFGCVDNLGTFIFSRIDGRQLTGGDMFCLPFRSVEKLCLWEEALAWIEEIQK
jgi:hypothetical protein